MRNRKTHTCLECLVLFCHCFRESRVNNLNLNLNLMYGTNILEILSRYILGVDLN